ncbi:MAG: hypothetical protein MUF58_00900 [Arcicella sp.]|jgi:hypothetical protein|nr:hypothetical protein [Arcicella sp.]
MKIKLLACFAFAVVLSSCAKEEEISPKGELSSRELYATKRPGMMSYSKPLGSTNFNNSWPLAKTVKPAKSPEIKPNESFNNSWPLAKFYF